MHTKPIAESDGTFTKDAHYPESSCPKCKVVGSVYGHTWESSCGGYTDYKLLCNACGHMWWIEGSDS